MAQFFSGSMIQSTAQSCIVDITGPTFSGISTLTQNLDGSLQAGWAAATDATSPINYEVYIQASTATGLFSLTPQITRSLSYRLFLDASGNPLVPGTTYFVGVRARDGVGNLNTNTASLSVAVTFSNFNTLAGQVWDQLPSAHNIASTFGSNLQSKVDVNVSTRAAAATALDNNIWTNARAALIDFLDVAISSRAPSATALSTAIWSNSRAANLDNLDVLVSSRASQTSVNNIQNNTDFVGIVQSPLILPSSGSKAYPFYVRLFNETNAPIDPDSNIMNYTIKDSAGSIVVAQTAMTRTGVGLYEAIYTVNSTDTERALYFFFDYQKSSVAFSQIRSTEVQEFESKLDVLLARLTSTRATNLDNLDAQVSTRSTNTDVQTLLARLTNTRANLLDNLTLLDVAVSSRASQSTLDTYFGNMSALVAQLTADIALIQNITNNAALIGGRSLILTKPNLIMELVIDPQLIP